MINGFKSSIRRLTFNLVAILFLVGIVNATNGEAASYYVATTGSDYNSCTAALNVGSPKQTVTSGITCMAGGDTLYIRSGTYAEGITSFKSTIPSGSAGSPTTFKNYNGEYVTLISPAGNPPVYSLVEFYDAVDYVTVSGLHLNGDNRSQDIVRVSPGASNIRIEYSEIFNAFDSGFLWAGDDGAIVGNDIHDNSHAEPYGLHGYGCYCGGYRLLIEGNDIHHNARYGLHVYPWNHAFDATIRNNMIHDNQVDQLGAGVLLSGYRHLFYNNVIWNEKAGGMDLYQGSIDIKIYNNTIYNTGNTAGGEQNGIYIAANTSGTIVRNNLIIGAPLPIVDYSPGAIFSNNLVTGNAGSLFVNAAQNNFALVAGSSAIDAGAVISPVADDFVRAARPQGLAYDIGAYEFSTGSGPMPRPAAPANVRLLP